MALQDLLDLSFQRKKVGLSPERIDAVMPIVRKYIAFWREYPDLFVDFMVRGFNEPKEGEFKFYFYQRVFLRSVMRYQYVYAVFPRAYSKSFLSVMALMIRCILYPGAHLFVTSGGQKIYNVYIKEELFMGSNKRPFMNRYIFEKINTEEKAYWLGFLYADGSVGSTDNRIELGLAEIDKNHIEKFKKFIGLENKISYRPKSKSYRYVFKDKIFKDILIKQGCIPKKSLTLKFPTEEQVPKELIRHFIRGYFDGDGCFCNTEDCFEASFIGTEEFIKGCLINLPNNLNTSLTIKDVHRKDGAKRYGFYSYNDVSNFLSFIYDNCQIYLERKYQKYINFLQCSSKYHKTL